MTQHSLYGLCFMIGDEPVIFYVGHTNNVERRRSEHRNNPFNPNHAEYMTHKYQWCRALRDMGMDYDLVVIVDDIGTDEDSEYAWIIKIARDNEDKGRTFYDDLPLTNMKAGDFLSEILADRSISTASDIKDYRQRRIEDSKPTGFYKRSELDYFNPTPRPLTQRAQDLAEWMNSQVDEPFADMERRKKQQREEQYQKMITDPARIARIQAETQRLMEQERDD